MAWRKLRDLPFHQDEPPMHPLEGLPFTKIQTHFLDLLDAYPEALDFEYEYRFKSHGYGAMTYWYQLNGKFKDEGGLT